MNASSSNDALDPTHSVWVSASAGSGKTTLLTERVLRLLLQNRIDNRPRLPNILCLTYTKAAAAEMQNRIHAQLGLWVTLLETDLQDKLDKTFDIKTSPSILKKARRLFAMVLERPDSIRIMTMHAFCQMILNRFPHEAGIAPHFTLLEGEEEKQFQQQVIAQCFADIKKNAELTQAWAMLGHTQASSRTVELIQQVFQHTGKWACHFKSHSTLSEFASALQKKLGLKSTMTVDDFLNIHCHEPALSEQRMLWAADMLRSGSSTDSERSLAITTWLNDKANRVGSFDDYVGVFLTQEETIAKTLATKKVSQKYPDVMDIMNQEARRVEAVVQQRNALLFYHQQCAFYQLGRHVWHVLDEAKHRHAQLTYDDLILKTRDLLTQADLAPWILYKLDGGIDHMLIDEAQDTSPEQWDIVFALLDEILAGAGARADEHRTLFVVGDEKQSIYSFQGANHHHYQEVKDKLSKRFEQLPKPMKNIERTKSYRSASKVLSFVDAVFKPDGVREGVSIEPIQHSAERPQQGLVELWPPIKTEAVELPPPWYAPMQRDDSKHAYIQLAERIAYTIRTWLNEGWQLKTCEKREGKWFHSSRPVKPDDIIILLQYRSHLLSPIIRALKSLTIPVAGIDRMVLHEQPAVQDVLSLCRFLLLPEDDLTLAEVLRGPFIRISDEHLFQLAHKRSGSLWNVLQQTAQHQAIGDYLKTLLNKVDTVSSFALLSYIYAAPCPGNPAGGRAALIHRLGMDAMDPLQQLLSAALKVDAQNPLSLQGFVRSIAEDDSELKREQSKASGEVRIMTTHGAKGLEAPIVIVPDLMRDPGQSRSDALVWDKSGFPYVATPVAKKIPLIKHIKTIHKTEREEEHRRLLYVALTRAADVLILCSAIKNKDPANSPWEKHMRDAMQCPETEGEENGDGITWRFGDRQTLSSMQTAAQSGSPDKKESPPSWLQEPLQTRVTPTIYHPSLLIRDDEAHLNPSTSMQPSSFARGRLLHRLLQLLPTLPEHARESAAVRFFERNAMQDAQANARDVREVMAVLRKPGFARVFSPAAQAEVPVIGTINGKRFAGQIDRLLVTDDEVIVIDFKTNRPPPSIVADVEDGYLAQMACYAALVSQIYPDKTLRAALLWTNTVMLMELDGPALLRGRQILDKTLTQ